MDTIDEVTPTARLNFGQRVTDPASVEETQTDAVQAEEAQQEAMTTEAPEVEAEAQTETSEAYPVDAPEAPVEDEAVQTVYEADAEVHTEEDPRVETAEASDVEQNVSSEEDLRTVIINELTEESKSVEELQAERDRLDNEIKSKQDRQKAEVLAQIKTVAETYGITADDVVEVLGGLKSKRKGVPAKPKYRDPATGIVWSGRGKEPAWIKGQDRAKFLIPQT